MNSGHRRRHVQLSPQTEGTLHHWLLQGASHLFITFLLILNHPLLVQIAPTLTLHFGEPLIKHMHGVRPIRWTVHEMCSTFRQMIVELECRWSIMWKSNSHIPTPCPIKVALSNWITGPLVYERYHLQWWTRRDSSLTLQFPSVLLRFGFLHLIVLSLRYISTVYVAGLFKPHSPFE